MKLCCCGMVASTAPRRSARIASSGQVRKVASSILCTKEEKKSSSIRFKMKAGKTISKNLVEKVVSTMPRKDKLSNSKPPVEKKVKVPKVFASLSRDLESKYMKPNHRYIIGVDEAGRGRWTTFIQIYYVVISTLFRISTGPLAGPVVAAACVIEGTVDIEGIIDSKATTEQSRVDTFQKLVNTPGIFYDVIRIEHNEIDEINILQASLKAMRLATEGVLRKMKEQHDMNAAGFEKLCVALVDGNRVPADMPLETMCVIKVKSNCFQFCRYQYYCGYRVIPSYTVSLQPV